MITQKIYVLDTSVLDSDPQALYAYPGNTVVIPLIVLQELDAQKNRLDAVGSNARKARKILESIRIENGGSLREPAKIAEDTYVQITINGLSLEHIQGLGLDPTINDNKIIASACGLQKRYPDAQVTVVSQDVSLRIIASQVGLGAEEYTQGLITTPPTKEEYKGYLNYEFTPDTIARLHSVHCATKEDLPPEDLEVVNSMCENEFVLSTGLITTLRKGCLSKVSTDTSFRVKAKSAPQEMALSLLLDDNIPFIAIEGQAGVGKTFLTLAAALHKTIDGDSYSKITIFRPVMEVGNQELGFLPGTLDEKISIWHLSTLDTLIALDSHRAEANKTPGESRSQSEKSANQALDYYKKTGLLEFASIGHVRGRNLENQFVIVDEVQNLEVSTVKTLLTRASKGTKIVLLGDTSKGQIDNAYVSPESNGLTQAIRAFRSSQLFGYVKLEKTERSELAEEAAKRL